MKPRLLNIAAGVSLLLAIAIVALWVRSYRRNEAITCQWHTSTEECTWDIESGYGSLDFAITRIPDAGSPTTRSYEFADWTASNFRNTLALGRFPFPPFRFQHGADAADHFDIRELTIAYWLLLLPTLPLPLIAFVRHRRRRQRETNNLCPTCGYDLRATPDRCPECGLRQAQSSEAVPTSRAAT